MQKGILVKNGSLILAKFVYAGKFYETRIVEDEEVVVDLIAERIADFQGRYPSYTFTQYEDDTDPEFADAVVDSPTEII